MLAPKNVKIILPFFCKTMLLLNLIHKNNRTYQIFYSCIFSFAFDYLPSQPMVRQPKHNLEHLEDYVARIEYRLYVIFKSNVTLTSLFILLSFDTHTCHVGPPAKERMCLFLLYTEGKFRQFHQFRQSG